VLSSYNYFLHMVLQHPNKSQPKQPATQQK